MKRRLFIALVPAEDLRTDLLAYQNAFKTHRSFSTIRWVSKQNLHVTVQFIGDVEETRVDAVSNVVREQTKGIGAIDLSVKTFRYHNSMLWIQFEDSRAFDGLVSTVRSAVKTVVPLPQTSKRQLPHATLARGNVSGQIEVPTVQPKTYICDVLGIYESVLRAAGPMYTIRSEVQL